MLGSRIIFTLLSLTILTVAVPASAHPGRTAADGCHYCRTNCAKWGEVEGARHCHNAPAPVLDLIEIPVEQVSEPVAPVVEPVDEPTTQLITPVKKNTHLPQNLFRQSLQSLRC